MREKKIELQKKVHRRVCVRNITFLAARFASQVIFCGFFRLIQFYAEKNCCFRKWLVTGALLRTQCLRSCYNNTI